MHLDISVILLSFNHEKYISKAIDSILDQQFTGNWELIIGDDCSNENTKIIINKYASQYPELIKSYSNVKNLGLSKNYEKAVHIAKGKYIAYLESDDYWTDNFKLQKQYNFLEINSQFVLAFHDFVLIDEFDFIISDKNLTNPNLKRNRTKKDMVTGCLIHQNTLMFRNVVRKLPIGFFKAKNHDTFLIAHLAKWGEAGYVKCKPLHYRISQDSLWSSLSKREKNFNSINTFFWILLTSDLKYSKFIFLKLSKKIKDVFLC